MFHFSSRLKYKIFIECLRKNRYILKQSYYLFMLCQLHAVSRTHQGRQRELRVRGKNSASSAELEALPNERRIYCTFCIYVCSNWGRCGAQNAASSSATQYVIKREVMKRLENMAGISIPKFLKTCLSLHWIVCPIFVAP